MPIASHARTSNVLVPISVDNGARAMVAAISSTVDSSVVTGHDAIDEPVDIASVAVNVRAV